jgi:DNA-binding ferritin-like protein
MIVKYQIGGSPMPPLDAKKLDKYCDKILERISSGGKSSVGTFSDAIKVIEALGEATRDRLKREKYTSDIFKYLKIK